MKYCFGFFFVTALVLAAPRAADAQSVLYCRDSTLATDAMEGALADYAAATPTATITQHLMDTNLTTCEGSLASGTFDLVIVAVQNNGPYTTPNFDAHVMGGGRAIFTDWTQTATDAAMFEASYASQTNQTSLTIQPPFDTGVVTNPITLMNPGWGTFSMTLTPDAGATSIASLGTGSGAVLSSTGRTIINGMLFDTGGMDLRRFFLNEVRALLGPDADGDGVDAPMDCDDFDPTVFPGAPDVACDGVDNNCDGTPDDGFMSTVTMCGAGACEATGMTTCVAGVPGDTCMIGTPSVDDPTCDGIDDDCDGTVDEDYASVDTMCGIGPCAATGTTTCVEGAVVDSCMPGTPAGEDTTCDAMDDDCDGAVDEAFAGATMTCGVGACMQMVAETCVDGMIEGACVPGTPAADDATCDGLDDDCDMSVDEDGACDETDAGTDPGDASTGTPDAGVGAPDAGTDPMASGGGCSCRVSDRSDSGSLPWALGLTGLLGLALFRRRR
ncbi:MAG: putative metal-binding motif-containing protein [Myxococcota bacterium]|nr:putative metal-binding motif-containing protein [Myxococcota bacterium]